MSEEEAIKICKNIIRSINGETCFLDYSKKQDKEAIETILDLYNKQKEEIEEEKEKWKELFHEYNKLVGEVIDKEQDLKDSISKDKIREVLEKERKKQKERDDISLALHSQYISLIDKIKKQLLEG